MRLDVDDATLALPFDRIAKAKLVMTDALLAHAAAADDEMMDKPS